MEKDTTANRLKYLMETRNLKQVDILELAKPFSQKYGIKLNKNDLSQYVSGKVVPGQQKLTILGLALNVSEAWLMGYDVPMERQPARPQTDNDKPDYSHVHNVIPLPISQKHVPLYDGIACGDPKFADSRMADMINLPEGVNADFAIVCHGDSMINLRIKDGDIVFIRDQQDVDDGEVAAVLIEDDATLKKVYHKPNGLLLMPANENYEPQIYTPDQLLNIRIMGKAVAFLSPVE